ncbi:N4-gp56 family major capsid protein [Desulfotalea psychrophila]|uniref:N4-gp56 family major capsid protein n=1 Tax=Desulfotalea psychrophila (strain LSv54 / DSM 12343) TaxID=177439 RepID=Q6ALP3_DESPS|nr:N4-gp56 family major capsid protein [Desulfotalea psychrophila]CAG36732.1 hypothetical protein DP2003 [Desulfotalea psychrophila LSv54]
MPTNIPYGDPIACTKQAVGLFAATTQRQTNLNRLAGKFPTQKGAEKNLRNQTSTDMPIVRCRDLQKSAGDEVTFDLINPIGGKPIMGGDMAEGRGVSMTFSNDKLRINQTRKPINAGDTMTQQRTPHQLRTLARAAGYGYMENLEDQLTLVHMAGARGFHNNIEWVVPLASDSDFTATCINPVRAPSGNRHFIANGGYLEKVSATAGEINIETTDVMQFGLMDALRAVVDSMPLPPPPVKFHGDSMASDDPLRVCLATPQQYASFIASGNFRTLQANAMQRASTAGGNPLFKGEAGLWNGILIVKMPKPIRFFAGDPINWCANINSSAETTTDLVPASFAAAGYAVDRALLLGGQALAQALGKHQKSGVPYFWSEKELDHGDKLEILAGMIDGKSKIRFEVDYGADGKQPTDHGIIAIDTAVKI